MGSQDTNTDGSGKSRPDGSDKSRPDGSDKSRPDRLAETDRSAETDESGSADGAVEADGPLNADRPGEADRSDASDRSGKAASATVAAEGLRKEYGETVAVRGVDLEIERGTVYGFLGPNGAGKTTTMRMLTGLIEPTAGVATVGGVETTDRRALVERIGLLPETPPLYEELTGREQLRFAADLRGENAVVTDRAAELADRLRLTEDLDRRIEGYSKGMRQKTAFVQAVAHDPDAVFLDEPTSGLDPRAARTLREMITELAAEGTAVMLSTHILPVVEEIADEVGVLFDGEIVASGAPSSLAAGGTDGDLEDVFLQLTTEGGWE